jgi:hypothetical protein
MAQFTVRVELHGADEDDYEVFFGAMETAGFSRYIASDEGVPYHLPWAEYNIEANSTRSEVLDIATSAAKATGRENSILVTQSSGRTGLGCSGVHGTTCNQDANAAPGESAFFIES